MSCSGAGPDYGSWSISGSGRSSSICRKNDMFSLLSSHGVLGMNARNLLYIKPFNPRKAVAVADDKLKTKAFLSARGIPVAEMYARIESRKQLRHFDFSGLPEECVLKPNYGFGGEGIMILKGRKNGLFLEQGKRPIPEQ